LIFVVTIKSPCPSPDGACFACICQKAERHREAEATSSSSLRIASPIIAELGKHFPTFSCIPKGNSLKPFIRQSV
jgi:hypothetical protein